ncbi:hypothetical protein FB451DRAFT_1171936 [Mycena latifolia]|nr:hypothetical protein FB451DRAFT_1171936 [Mycena latifolia]
MTESNVISFEEVITNQIIEKRQPGVEKIVFTNRPHIVMRSAIVNLKFSLRSGWAAKKGINSCPLKELRFHNHLKAQIIPPVKGISIEHVDGERPTIASGSGLLGVASQRSGSQLYCTRGLESSIVRFTSAARPQTQNEAARAEGGKKGQRDAQVQMEVGNVGETGTEEAESLLEGRAVNHYVELFLACRIAWPGKREGEDKSTSGIQPTGTMHPTTPK